LIVGDHGLDPGKSPLSGAPIGRFRSVGHDNSLCARIDPP
jgi:hypothetical protein